MISEKQCKHGVNIINVCMECLRETHLTPRVMVLCNALKRVADSLRELETVCYDESLKREAAAIRKALKARYDFFSGNDEEIEE